MPGVSQIVFVVSHLSREDVQGKKILDVGSKDFNGSIRPLIESWNPSEYIGVDVEPGKGVDIVLDAVNLDSVFEPNSFDIILCLEMLEHAPLWNICIEQMKKVCKENGKLFLTTRSLGYPCHGFPNDHWRFEIEDLKIIFKDFSVHEISKDPVNPGVFIYASKPESWNNSDLSNITLFNINLGKKALPIEHNYKQHFYFYKLLLKQKIRLYIVNIFMFFGRLISSLFGIK